MSSEIKLVKITLRTYIDDDKNIWRKCNVCQEFKPNNKEHFKPMRKWFNGSCHPCLSEVRSEEGARNAQLEIERLAFGDFKMYDLNKKTSYVDSNEVYYKVCPGCKELKVEKDNFNYFNKTGKSGKIYKKCENNCKSCRKLAKQKRDFLNKDEVKDRRQTPEFKEKRREAKKKRLREDICYKLRENVSGAVSKAIKRSGARKNGASVLKYLPFKIDELKMHLEKQFDENMTWENHGSYWQIDHIIPQSDLPYDNMERENFKICWSLENLRPLDARQNLLDGVNRTRHKNKRRIKE